MRQVKAAAALLARNPRRTGADIDTAMAGILYRCATYPRVRAAIHEAARQVEHTGQTQERHDARKPVEPQPAPTAMGKV